MIINVTSPNSAGNADDKYVKSMFHLLKLRSTKSFADAAPRPMNSLPDSLHKLSSRNNFTKHSKSHLFKTALAQHDKFDLMHFWGIVCCLQRDISCLHYLLTVTENFRLVQIHPVVFSGVINDQKFVSSPTNCLCGVLPVLLAKLL